MERGRAGLCLGWAEEWGGGFLKEEGGLEEDREEANLKVVSEGRVRKGQQEGQGKEGQGKQIQNYSFIKF